MSLKQVKLVPVFLAIAVIAVVCVVQSLRFTGDGSNPLERLEWITHNWRAQYALTRSPVVTSNLAFVQINDLTIKRVREGHRRLSLRNGYGLYWPRMIYGRVVRELRRQGARGVAFDVLFSDTRPDHDDYFLSNRVEAVDGYTNVIQIRDVVGGMESVAGRSNVVPVFNAYSLSNLTAQQPESPPTFTGYFLSNRVDGATKLEGAYLLSVAVSRTNSTPIFQDSDDFLAEQLLASGNVILASTPGLVAHQMFAGAACGLGDISSRPDADGVLRRAYPFQYMRIWHQNILEQVGIGQELFVEGAEVTDQLIVFTNSAGHSYRLPLDREGRFNLHRMTSELLPGYEDSIPENNHWQRPFEARRVWHMGIVMAAMELGLDLENALVAPRSIHLPGTNGVSRTIPLDHQGRFLIDWAIPDEAREPGDIRLAAEALEYLILNDTEREQGIELAPELLGQFKDKLVFIGSSATGNELSDRGVTPLGNETLLVSKHWNVANSLITGQIPFRSGAWFEYLVIVILGAFAALCSWWMRPPWSTLSIVAVAGLYTWYAFDLFARTREWIPLFMPIAGAMLWNHGIMIAYQVVFEGQERRRVRGVFSKLVSPNVVNELLEQKEIHLGGQRRRITVFFSDVRGFTTMTDEMQQYADDYIQTHGLTGEDAENFRDHVAADTLETVNLYLATIADQIKKHNGTLDKYIGDCVMAFWGAPTPNERHAIDCVRSTIDAQLAMDELNVRRASENAGIELENERRLADGRPPLPLKRLLVMGSGINTGTAIVGLMGSEDHTFNYTVFGREVNLASRLEGVSGRSRIIIGEATFRDLEKLDPDLAATCVEQDPVKVKGIGNAVRNWEVPWRIYKKDPSEEKMKLHRRGVSGFTPSTNDPNNSPA